MKKTNKKKNNDNQKLLVTIIAVALIIAIIGGATFAYWSWQSNNAQKTNVTVEVEGATFTIVGNNITNTGMYPTADCDGAGALVGDVATVTIVNETESPMTASLKLRASLTKKQGTLDATNKGKLNWAVVDTTAGTTCETTTYKGTLANVTTNTDIDTGISFVAAGTTRGAEPVTTTKTYRVYVWLDSSYTYTNSGSTVSDPMQDLTISVKWSPASTLIQGS